MSDTDFDFEELSKLILANPVARVAAAENSIRRTIGSALRARAEELGHSVRALGKLIGTSPSQVQRLLHEDLGGSLTLTTICRAADALGLVVTIDLVPKAHEASWPDVKRDWSHGATEVTTPSPALDSAALYARTKRVRESAWSSVPKSETNRTDKAA